MNRKEPGLLQTLMIFLIAVPMLGLMAGGIYSLPAIKMTKGKEPWLSLLLAVGLAITIAGLGRSAHLSWASIGCLWLGSVVLLMLARWFYGSLDHSLEYFGVVHMVTLMAVLSAVTWKVSADRKKELQEKAAHAAQAKQ
jgi:hypothetical protein